MKNQKIIFLDRDETLNHDPGYLRDASLVQLKDTVPEGLSLLREFGFRFVVLTNQSGVGRGVISPRELSEVNARISEILGENNIHLEKIYICPHTEKDNCNCRKPAAGLLEQAMREFNADPEHSYLVGDRMRDILPGVGTGIEGVLVPGRETVPEEPAPNLIFTADSMLDAAGYILQREFEKKTAEKIFFAEQKDAIQSRMQELKAKNKKIVFTNGVFDILHPGHVQYLYQASQLGDHLVLGLNSDESVKRLKGPERPVNTALDRALVLARYKFIKTIIIFSDDTPVKTLETVRPAVHVKGGDYIAEKLPEYKTVTENGGRVIILPFRKGYSTTSVIERMRRRQ